MEGGGRRIVRVSERLIDEGEFLRNSLLGDVQVPNDSRFNVDDPRFDQPRQQREQPASQPLAGQPLASLPDTPKKRRSAFSTCLTGCLISFVVLAVAAALVVYWISQNWRDLASSIGSDALKEGINATELPDQEKADIEVQIDRLAVELREGRLTGRQMQFIVEQVAESPLMTIIVASAIERKYIANSGLDEAEKVAGRQTIRRFLRGSIDGEINRAGIDAAMQHVATRKEGNNWELKGRVSDEDLRSFLIEAKKQADDADIPMEADDIDPSDEFQRIVDEAMLAP